jgi:hypothetical protein
VATTPASACAQGTTAPTAGNLEATATPQAFSFRSHATIENVDGLGIILSALIIPCVCKPDSFDGCNLVEKRYNLYIVFLDHTLALVNGSRIGVVRKGK